VQTAVLDSGAGTIKIGIAGEEVPSVVVPNIIGAPKDSKLISSACIGDDALLNRSLLNFSYPILSQTYVNWDELENVWKHAFTMRSIDPHLHPLLVTAQSLVGKSQKEKLIEILFEKFEVPATYLSNAAMCALYSLGKTTGVVVDCGELLTTVTPVYEGFVLLKGVSRTTFGGRDLVDYLIKILAEKPSNITIPLNQRESAREIKERFGRMSFDYKADLNAPTGEKEYTFPDGKQTIKIGNQQFRCSEPIFQPSLLGDEHKADHPLHQLIYSGIMKCAINTRKELYENVFGIGGTSMFPMFEERLTKELKSVVPPTINLKVKSPPERKYSVWSGSSILGTLGALQKMWIQKEHYDETGADVVHKKCPH